MRCMRAGCILFAFVYAFFVVADFSNATPLSVLVRDKGVIIANDKFFSDFAIISQAVTNGGKTDIGLIDVTPLTNDPLDPGLNFVAPLDALGTPFGHQEPSSAFS